MGQMDLKALAGKVDTIERARDVSVFKPNDAQRLAKSTFWSYFIESHTPPPEVIELSTALRYGASKGISDWWSLPGFQDWFTNKDEFRQRIEYLASLCLDELEHTVRDRNGNPTARTAAIRMILQASNKLTEGATSKGGTFLDESVSKMDRNQLLDFISARAGKALEGQANKPIQDLTTTKADDTVE